MAKVRIVNKNTEQLFNYINSHLTLLESSFIKYDMKDSIDKVKIPQPIKKSDQSYLEKFLPQSRKISPEMLSKMMGIFCTICYQSYSLSENYRQLYCHHLFHTSCIDKWMINDLDDLTCPLCRKSQYDEYDQYNGK